MQQTLLGYSLLQPSNIQLITSILIPLERKAINNQCIICHIRDNMFIQQSCLPFENIYYYKNSSVFMSKKIDIDTVAPMLGKILQLSNLAD